MLSRAMGLLQKMKSRVPGIAASLLIEREEGIKQPVRILVMAVWFGIVAGLVEGVGSLALLKLGLRGGFWVEIVWVSAAFNTLMFGAIGLLLAAVARIFPRLPITLFSAFLLAFLTFSSWLSVGLDERIHQSALLVLAVGLAVAFAQWFHKRQSVAQQFWRKSLPLVAALAMLAFAGIQGTSWLRERIAIAQIPPAAADAPNILVIVVDTLRADHLALYGYERLTSPNIDRLAQEGVVFEAAFSTSPWTLPSHASMLTGRFPHEHGAERSSPRALMDSPYPTLAEALYDRGYRTAAFSGNTFWFTREQGFGRGFTHFEDYFQSISDMAMRTVYGGKFHWEILRRAGVADTLGRQRAADINRSVVRWLENETDRPFFVFLNYFDVHEPYLPPQPYRSKFFEPENPGGTGSEPAWRVESQMTTAELESGVAAYDGAISYVDDQIAQLISDIRGLGLGDNLLIVLTSDHGEAFGEHGAFAHTNSVYREEIHVPLILWQPGQIPAGARVSQPVTNASIPTTVMELISEGEQGIFPNQSLARLWQDPEVRADWPFPVAEMEHWPWMPEESPSHHGSMRSLISPEYQYIEHETLGTELYAWPQDPLESHNLADSAEGQSIIDWFNNSVEAVFSPDRR